jgi:hypothetical protein
MIRGEDETERYVRDVVERAKAEERACSPTSSVPRAGRRFLPRDVLWARRGLYVTFAIMLAIWSAVIVLPLVRG